MSRDEVPLGSRRRQSASSHTSVAAAAGSTFTLVTLGRLALLGATGVEEASLTTRRRKLALLAYLAMARRPVARSVLIDVFWGERGEERARKSLSDALSHLRRVLGPGLIATYASEIAIDHAAAPAVDALELKNAARAGDHERVLSLYHGPFLQGVFIEGSTAFEDWSAHERRSLEDTFAAACAAVCRTHAGAGAWQDCEEVAERWLEVRPASAEAALRLLEAVSAPGTHESRLRALECWHRVRQRLAREYEIEPEPAVRAFAVKLAAAVRAEVRARAADATSASVEAEHTQPPTQTVAAAPSTESVPRLARTTSGESVPAFGVAEGEMPRRARGVGPRVRALAGAFAVLLVAAAVLRPFRPKATEAAPAAEAPGAHVATPRPTVAIAPFVTSADDPTSRWTTEALPGLIAAKLAHFEQLEVVPAEQMAGASDAPIDRARRFNAGIIATGVLTRRDSALTLDLSLQSADRQVLARHVLEGANVLALADLAAVRVLNAADVVTAGPTLGELETSSVAAYQHYHLAMHAAMGGDPAESRRHLDAAIALDSGFVAALLERYRMAVDLVEPAVTERLRPALRRSRDRMSEGDRLGFDAEEALYAGDAARSEFLAATLADRYPHSARALAAHIKVSMLHGRFAEVEREYTRLLALSDGMSTPDQRSLWCGHLSGRAEFRRVVGNAAGAVADLRRATEQCPGALDVWSKYAWALLAAGRIDDARRAADRAGALRGSEDRWLVGHILLRQRRWAAVDSAVRRWLAEGPAGARGDALDLQSAALREQGRYHDALALDERGRRSGEFNVPQVHLDNLSRAGEFARLRAYRREFAPADQGVLSMLGDTLRLRGEGARGWTWHHALYGDAAMRSGDTAAVRALADSIPAVGRRSYYARDWRVHHHLRGLLAANAGSHEEAIREFRAAMWGPAGWTRTNVELARSYLALGRPAEALAILRPAYGANLDAMGRYATLTEIDYHMALAFRASGMRDSAAVYAAYVRRAWANADPVVAPLLVALEETPAHR